MGDNARNRETSWQVSGTSLRIHYRSFSRVPCRTFSLLLFVVGVSLVVELCLYFAGMVVYTFQMVQAIPILLYAHQHRPNLHCDRQTYQIFLHELMVRLRLGELDYDLPR